jgi:hypothetical protein
VLYAFIDESGQRGRTAGASPYFVIAAVVVRDSNVQHATEALAKLRSSSGRQPHQALAWKKLTPGARTLAARELGRKGFLKITSVVVCKHYLPSSQLPSHHHRYAFALRLLLERVSWLAHEHGETFSYTISHITGYTMKMLRGYEARIREDPECSIRWECVSGPGTIGAPRTTQELQLADLAASGIAAAFNPHLRTGLTDRSYLIDLRPRLYCPPGRELSSYGLKMLPWDVACRQAHPWVSAL